MRDQYTLREPFVALLPADDQLDLAARFGFDWQSKGRSSAIFLILFAAGVVFTTFLAGTGERVNGADLVTLVCMGYLGTGQLIRLQRISQGSTGWQRSGATRSIPVSQAAPLI